MTLDLGSWLSKPWLAGKLCYFRANYMKTFFSPNIDNKGRAVRGCMAAVLFIAAGLAFYKSQWWLGGVLAAGGGFVLFEALRGWCVARACGVKTRL